MDRAEAAHTEDTADKAAPPRPRCPFAAGTEVAADTADAGAPAEAEDSEASDLDQSGWRR